MNEKVVIAIHELANAIGGLGGSWQQQAVSLLVLIVVAAVGSYAGAYFKTRGAYAGFRSDLDRIEDQVSKQTKATETIKSQISKQSEFNTLRIKKLEELMEAFLVAENTYRKQCDELFKVKPAHLSNLDNMEHALMLAKFYFADFVAPLEKFSDSWMDCLDDMLKQRNSVFGQREGESVSLALTLWGQSEFPMRVVAQRESRAMESLLVNEMRKLLGEAEPKEAGHAPA